MPKVYGWEVIQRAKELRASGLKFAPIQTILSGEFNESPSYGTLHRWFSEGVRDDMTEAKEDIAELQQALDKALKRITLLEERILK